MWLIMPQQRHSLLRFIENYKKGTYEEIFYTNFNFTELGKYITVTVVHSPQRSHTDHEDSHRLTAT